MISLRRRLALHLGLPLAAGALVAALGVWWWARRSLLTEADTALAARAGLIASAVEADDGHLELELDLTKLPGLADDGHPTSLFQIRSRSGTPLITSPAWLAAAFPDTVWESRGHHSIPAADGTPHRVFVTAFNAPDDADAAFSGLRLAVARPVAGLHRRVTLLATAALGGGALLSALLLLLLRRALRHGLQPVEAFAAHAAAADLNSPPKERPALAVPVELAPAAAKFDELLVRVHQSLERERRFARDVAHELRTPVAELRSLGDLVARWPDTATPETLAEVGAIAEQMESLVTSLTLLNRLDAGRAVLSTDPVDVAALLARVASRATTRASAFGHRLHLPPLDMPIIWRTDPMLWASAAGNLLGNAVAHSPPCSDIHVALSSERFSVRNPAPQLDPADVSLMLQPFWRKDAARSGQDHSGLGLPLVHAIARALHLELQLIADSGFLTATLSFSPLISPRG